MKIRVPAAKKHTVDSGTEVVDEISEVVVEGTSSFIFSIGRSEGAVGVLLWVTLVSSITVLDGGLADVLCSLLVEADMMGQLV